MNALSKQKRAIRRMMRKPRSLKLRGYAAQLIELNEYFTVFPGENISDFVLCDRAKQCFDK